MIKRGGEEVSKRGKENSTLSFTLLLSYSFILLMITYWRVWSVLAFVQPC